MNYFRKMVMLPIDEFNKYKNILYMSQVTPNPNPMQQELENVRNIYGTSLPDDMKTKLESEIIQKYSSKNTINEPSLPKPDPQKLAWISQSIQNFPRGNKNRAQRLHNFLETKVQNRWNENGELLTTNGDPIRNSNILDLINFVTTSQKYDHTPVGFSDFIILLNEANVPTHMISKNGMNHIEDNIDKQMSVDEEEPQQSISDHDDGGFYTPELKSVKKRKKKKKNTPFRFDDWTS